MGSIYGQSTLGWVARNGELRSFVSLEFSLRAGLGEVGKTGVSQLVQGMSRGSSLALIIPQRVNSTVFN